MCLCWEKVADNDPAWWEGVLVALRVTDSLLLWAVLLFVISGLAQGPEKTASPPLTLDFSGGKCHWKPGYLLLQLPLCSPLGRPEVSPVHRLPMRLLEMPFYVMLESQFLKNTKNICGKLPPSWIKRNLNQEVETRYTSLLPIKGVRKCS